ncbi:o-succinylbenzoate synthase [Fischerella thermalis]|uniref:o-succinylbenzoate synthase n=7 Tax=Fischerella TaxID=1190 RepID=G6FY04_9CYAN|nr:o-succinylbenzoate synthase [Fischerella thermalis]EHC10216.1 o-succinylbenzoic acid (OSB) synthetase [Fischerella thermalis JSC-11]PLZ07867.1 o-succinylbenzoate synthase [Fischerella thermalis WC119]PLZ13393.1 o-succinylbenzoate synthase [Fischerella thermalis WC1110]PLZ18850.1 o-succinylbenzoate synthase [Fischerella thermalis WC157]PLZ38570.1 o-succinylbenzoate synthase [Fischerella thermalis WC538]
MNYQFDFRPYRRKFVRGVATSHGVWEIREGIILRLTDETNKVGWGEIAPISWFGSETLAQAWDFCCHLPQEITEETIFSIPDQLPACQFGFESALWEMKEWNSWRMGDKRILLSPHHPTAPNPHSLSVVGPPSSPSPHLPMTHSALLPAGEAALQAWENLWQQGYSTFKWKIGVYPTPVELKILDLLTQSLPASAKLRLDANGGLNQEQAKLWLESCDRCKANIEFLEQPLSVDEFPVMLELSQRYQTAIALDESVATLPQLKYCFQQGWRGIFVIKPGIVGSPSRLRQFCQQHEIDAVFSSVFETAIGRKAALQIAVELSRYNRAMGFGVDHYFVEEEGVGRWGSVDAPSSA